MQPLVGAADLDTLIRETGLAVEADDDQLLLRGMFVYDALYAHCGGQAPRGQVRRPTHR